MSDDLAAVPEANGVSPLRKKISTVVLLVLLVVLLVEVRAGMGQSLSGKALQETSPDGVFEKKTPLASIESLMSLAPSKSVVLETKEEFEYRYSWFSVLRPILQRPEAAFYVTTTKLTDPLYAVRYNTEAPTAEAIAKAKASLDYVPPEDTAENQFGGGEDAGGFGGPPEGDGGERKRPAFEDSEDEAASESDESAESEGESSKTDDSSSEEPVNE